MLTTQFARICDVDLRIQPGTRILLAVSGGIDSMVMLDLFARLAPSRKYTLGIAHINHKLRPDASQDESLIVKTASKKTDSDVCRIC